MRMKILAIAACLSVLGLCIAMDSEAAEKRATNIPAQPLEAALHTLAKVHSVEMIYRSEVIGGHQSSAAIGQLTCAEALEEVLSGTGLTYRYIDDKMVTIVPVANPQPIASPRATGYEPNRAIHLAQADIPPARAENPSVAAAPSQDGSGSSTEPADELAGRLDTVTVSSSRIRLQGYEQPTPVTVVGVEQLERDAKTDIGDAIRQLPAFGGSSSPNNSVNSSLIVSGVQGLNLVSLRNLGANRTLVLFDGQRVSASNIRGGVDLSTVPSSLVERVEVVTGGASAAWGSDAVAGVVNLIVNKRFSGVQGNLEYGDNWQGTHPQRKAELSFGTDFAGDRGHVILSASYLDFPDTLFAPQMQGFKYQKLVSNPAYAPGNGQPKLLHADYVGLSGYTQGGVITTGPLAGIQFVGPNGTPTVFKPGNISGDLYADGPSADYTHNDIDPVTLPAKNYNLFAYASYKLTDNIKASVQLNYGRSSSTNDTYNNYATVTVTPDNAYLQQILTANPGFAAQYAAAGNPAFDVGTLNTNNLSGKISDFDELVNTVGGTVSRNHRRLQRGVFSLDGTIGSDWTWNAYFQRGEGRADLYLLANARKAFFQNAAHAVYVTPANAGTSGLALGSIACASPATGVLIPECAPLNIFGNGVASPEAIAYIQSSARAGLDAQNTIIAETVAAASSQGTLPWGLEAGRMSTAFGVEYRKEAGNSVATPLAAQRPTNFPYGNFSSFNGNYHVEEGFLEFNVPLLKDKGVKSLNVDAAGRLTRYSTSGTVETWKLGLTSQITDDVRFRGSYSRDIRAPNLQELFSGGTLIASGNKVDPHTGLTVPNVFDLTGGGNPDLVPEEATTRSVGVILTPRWINNLSLSVDYYNIKIEKAIDSFGDNQILEQCAAGNQVFCDSIVFGGAGGALSQINTGFVNADSDLTSGVDLEADYRLPVYDGTLAFHLLGNYVFEQTFTALGTTTDFVGSLGIDSTVPAFANAIPKLRATLAATYAQGPWSATLQTRFIGPAHVNTAWTQGVDIDNNDIGSIAYFDARASFTVGNFNLYGAIDNLTNKYSQFIPFSAFIGDPSFTVPTRDDIYDSLGRVYRVGIRARF